jgi:hypothetical protein
MGAGKRLALERKHRNSRVPQGRNRPSRLPPKIVISERRPAKLDIESVPRVVGNERPKSTRTQCLLDDATDAMRLCVGNDCDVQTFVEEISIPSDQRCQPLD